MFLPTGDTPNPKNFTPWVNWILIGLNIGIYILVSMPLSSRQVDPGDPLVAEYLRTIQNRIPPNVHPMQIVEQLSQYDLFLFQHGYKPGAPNWMDLFFSMFLHGGLLHLLGNMLFLWIFGDNVEGRLGHLRYLLFYIICGVAASVFHTLINPDSLIPTVGASGAIYGVLGAYWLCFPHSMVTVFYWIFILFGTFQMRASWVLGIYVGLDLFKGLNNTGGNVAVWAHVGGFFAGLGLVILMTPKSARGKRPTRWSVIR